MLVITMLFTKGKSLGIKSVVDEDSEAFEDSAYFTNNDRLKDWDSSDATTITLKGNKAKIKGKGAYQNKDKVVIAGGGKYVLTGNWDDGSIVVEAYESSKVYLMFDGVSVNCSDNAALMIKEADKVFLTLKEGSTNSLVSGSDFSEEAMEDGIGGAIFARDDLTINGSGKLTIQSGYKHGIDANDDLVITGGSLSITAEKDGIHVNDSFRMMDADLSVDAGDEGIAVTGDEGYFYAESGSVSVKCNDDAIHAVSDVTIAGGDYRISAADDGIHSDQHILIEGGSFEVTECYEGLEAGIIDVTGGDLRIYPADDGMNAFGDDPCITISGGKTVIINQDARDADGLDSNGDIFINGGEVYVSLPGDGSNNALDFGTENGGVCEINGGFVLACGGSVMMEELSDTSAQCSVMYNLTESVAGGSMVTLTDAGGNELFNYEVPVGFNSLILSLPEMKQGETYSLQMGEQTEEITLDSMATLYGTAGGFPGGFPGDGNGGPGGAPPDGDGGPGNDSFNREDGLGEKPVDKDDNRPDKPDETETQE